MSDRPEIRAAVLRRDHVCVLSLVDHGHQCRDKWGEPHDPNDIGKLTLEHVRTDPGGMRRDDELHCVAMCHEGNVMHAGSTTENRARLNAYLLGVSHGQRHE